MRKVYIFGYSGHAYVLLESMFENGMEPAGYFDFKKADKNPYRLDYMGFEKAVDLAALTAGNYVFPAIGDNLVRKNIIELMETCSLPSFVLTDKTAIVSSSANIGHST